MTEHFEDHTEDGLRTFSFTTAAPVRFAFTGRYADLHIEMDAAPGQGQVLFSGGSDLDLSAIAAEIHDGHVGVRMPHSVDTTGGGFSFAIGGAAFSFGRRPSVDVTVSLPEGSSVEVTTMSGDVSVSGRSGEVRIRSASGDISVDAASTIHVDAGSGDVSVERCEGGHIGSGSGDITVSEVAGGIEVRSGSGDISVATLSSDARIASGSGDIGIDEVIRGDVDAHSATGDISVGVRSGVPTWLDLSSGSGDVDRSLSRRGEPEPGSAYVRVKAVTTTGDITVDDA